MLALLEIAFFLLFLPFVLFGLLLGYIGQVLTAFEPRLFLAAVWCVAVGAYLAPHSEVDDSRPFVTLVESLAQSHIGPVPMPVVFLSVACWLAAVAAVVAARRSKNP